MRLRTNHPPYCQWIICDDNNDNNDNSDNNDPPPLVSFEDDCAEGVYA